METPQIIYIILTAMGFTFVAMQHGKPKDGKYNIWVSGFASAIIFGILYWGGFFTNCGQ